jgi:glycogen operon protein
MLKSRKSKDEAVHDECRIAGSADLYADDGRLPGNSINFITCHDGFTLHDLVTYNAKRNEANGEDNRDGTDDNASWNCGAEGETTDPAVLALRLLKPRTTWQYSCFRAAYPCCWRATRC